MSFVYLPINPLPTKEHHTALNCSCPLLTNECHTAHFIPTQLYFIITGFILTPLSQDDWYGLIEVYYNYIYRSKVSSSSYVAVARVFVWAVDKSLLVFVRLAQATVYIKPKQVIHCCVEHLLLEVLICNTYYVELPRAESDHFSTVS